ncbi:hypothetical protein BDZ94DRAFT_1262410 [Collybia nuda]|uniref:Uncharacterized protein n=1 Tax=Collybia nuda TaxID=64659 RepID=A0A9P5Y250_9AGAR|nr:hypothetical protein BDZ94DRAFT_1262410 [Collybia nuda]
MAIRAPYPQGPSLAAPTFYRPSAPDYPGPYSSPSISSSSSSASDSSSGSSLYYPATPPTAPDYRTPYYSAIPAHYFDASKDRSSSPTYPATRPAHPPRASSYRTTHNEEQKSRAGDKRERGQSGVEQHQEPYCLEDDEMLAWRIHEEELAAIQTEVVDLQHEQELRRALEESRRMANLDSRCPEKSSSMPRSVHAGHEPSQRAVPTAGSVPRQKSSAPLTPQSQSRPVASTSRQPQASTSRATPPSYAHPLFGYRTLFIDGQHCSRCFTKIPVFERNGGNTLSHGSRGPLGSLLHMTCPSCATIQCRGCAKAVACPRRCTGGQQCTLPACCSEVRAIAIFEVLVDFDRAFSDKVAELHANSQSQQVLKTDREMYLDLATSWVDTRVSEPLKSILAGTLSKLAHWLAGELHASTALLISTSHLLEVIQAFLLVPNASDWLRRRAVYGQILDFLRCLATRHMLHALVMSPRQDIQQTRVLQNIIVSATYLEDASPNPPRSIYEVAISGPSLKEMERYACRAHLPQLAQDAQVLWQGLKYLELVKALGSDTD